MKTAAIRINENGEAGCARIGCSCMQGEEGVRIVDSQPMIYLNN